MADFCQLIMIISWSLSVLGQCIYGSGWKGVGLRWVVAKAKTRK